MHLIPMKTAANDTTAPFSPAPRVDWIDVARLLAILLVMQAHSTFCMFFNHDSEAGAVAFFFLTSGYFTKRKGISAVLKRLFSLIPFYIIWSLYGAIVENHGFNFSVAEFGRDLIQGSNSSMWFILYLIYFTLVGAVLAWLPKWISTILFFTTFSIGVYQYLCAPTIHPCLNIYLALSVFILGQMSNSTPPEVWKIRLFHHPRKISQYIPPLVLGGILLMSATDYKIIPSWILIFPAMWAILGTAYGICLKFPHVGQYLAGYGTAVVFTYAVHMPTLRMFTSAYIRVFGSFPPLMISAFFIVLIVIICTLLFRLLHGRVKIIDTIFFAR